ncbi:hypothetical protein TrRE_jg7414, partial [Triparma retinervis]
MGNASTSKRNLSRGVRGKQKQKESKLSNKKKNIAAGLVHEYHDTTFAEAAECRDTFLDLFGSSQFHLNQE